MRGATEVSFAPTPHRILAVQVLCWCSILALVLLSSWQWMVAAALMYVVYGGLGISLTFHRILSHGAFKLKPLVRKTLITLASFANVGSPITWVAVHRAHHRYVDTAKDPHSPQFYPWWYMLFGTMFSKVHPKFAVDLLRDPFCRFIHQYYFALQVPWAVVLWLLGGWEAVAALHLAPAGLTWLGGSTVNYLNHLAGYQPYGHVGTSTNNLLTGFLVMGEGWHNAHHAFPTKATTRTKWWEFDLVFWLGRLVGQPRR